MLSGVQARVVWVQSEDENWKLSAGHQIVCPWHAITVELIRAIAEGKQILERKCPHPECEKMVRRFSARTCGEDKCRTYYQRHKTRIA